MMISSVVFKNYRNFREFDLNQLTRVNLLVGLNNSGKSSILEGLYYLTSANWQSIQNILLRRGWLLTNQTQNQFIQTLNIKQSLFNWDALEKGDLKFSIHAKNSVDEMELTYRFFDPTSPENFELQAQDPNAKVLYAMLGHQGLQNAGSSSLLVDIYSKKLGKRTSPLIPVFDDVNVRLETLQHLNQAFNISSFGKPSIFILSENNDLFSASAGWAKTAFKKELVEKVIHLLHLTLPNHEIEGIQTLQMSPNMPSAFYVKLIGVEHPVPLGVFGEGMRRLLYLCLSFPQAAGGALYIDEIETGIHHSMMGDMWRLIFDLAAQFNVQVFASSHSKDCIESLKFLKCNEDFSVHRIDSKNKKSVDYSHAEIIESIRLDEEIRGV